MFYAGTRRNYIGYGAIVYLSNAIRYFYFCLNETHLKRWHLDRSNCKGVAINKLDN